MPEMIDQIFPLIFPSPLDAPALADKMAPYYVADVVEALNGLDPSDAAKVLETMPLDRAAETLKQPGFEHPQKIVERLPVDCAVAILGMMPADRRADIFRRLKEPLRSHLASRLAPVVRTALQQLLAYPARSAGSIMTKEFIAMPAEWTVGRALNYVREVGRYQETIYVLYVVDTAQHLMRAISLRQLILSDSTSLIGEVGPPRRPITVTPLIDREEVARLISKYDLLAVPVVDDAGKMLGIVTVDDIVDAIVQESTEDVQKFGGMDAITQPYMQTGFATMIRKRAGWLCVLFLSEMLTASAMQTFQGELEKALVLTLFIPLIMSSGGNSGSQATSLIIRAMALREVEVKDWWRVAGRELPAGLTLGAILGVIGIARITLWQALSFYDYGPHWVLVAATVGLTLVGIVTFGSLAGSMLPFALKRISFDPASASAPFVATLVDVTGLVIYFGIAYVVLKGTLL